MPLTAKGGWFGGPEGVARLREQSTSSARVGAAKQAGRGPAGCSEAKPTTGRRCHRLTERAGAKKTTWER